MNSLLWHFPCKRNILSKNVTLYFMKQVKNSKTFFRKIIIHKKHLKKSVNAIKAWFWEPKQSVKINSLNLVTRHTEFITLKTANCTMLLARAVTAEFQAMNLKRGCKKDRKGKKRKLKYSIAVVELRFSKPAVSLQLRIYLVGLIYWGQNSCPYDINAKRFCHYSGLINSSNSAIWATSGEQMLAVLLDYHLFSLVYRFCMSLKAETKS